MASRRAAREWAVQFLFQRDYNPGPKDGLSDLFWVDGVADGKARLFAEELVQGVFEHREELDALIQKHAENWSLARMGGVDRNIMRVAVFEMLYRPDIPPVVSINEAVELAKNLGDSGSSGFVNGILDKVRMGLSRPARG